MAADRAPASARRFSGREGDYRSHRPGYAAEAVEFLLSDEGLGDWRTLVDIGSGTGKLSAQLLEGSAAEVVVIGLEPNDAMRATAESELAGDRRFHSRKGSAERTGLADGSVDAITVAQAFHWFDFARTRKEFQRIARSGARCAVLWNLRSEEADAFHRDYERFLLDWGVDYEQVRESWRVAERMAPLFRAGYRREVFETRQTLTREGLLGRFHSSSYAPNEAHPRHGEATEALIALFDQHAGSDEERGDASVEMIYRCEVHVGVI